MAHLPNKYNRTYFLGGIDRDTGLRYGVLGYKEFLEGGIHDRLKHEADVAIAFMGSLKGLNVLDVGMGRGDLIPIILREGACSYTGIDMSADALEIARDKFADSRVRFMLREAMDLDDESAYDLILLLDALEHIPVFEMELVWPRLHRALRPGGGVFMSTPIYEDPNVSDHTERKPSVCGIHCNKQTEGTLLRSFLRHGFTVVCVRERIFGVVRSQDLSSIPEPRRTAYLETHARTWKRVAGSEEMPGQAMYEALVPAPGRIAVGCVAEDSPEHLSQALRLLSSLRLAGGRMSGANFFACFLRLPDEAYVHEFERLGAFVRVVPRFTDKHPHSNRMGFFELPELRHYDTLLLLDCDTAIVHDPLPCIDGRKLQCKPAGLQAAPHEIIERVYAHFGLRIPPQESGCGQDGASAIMYCDPGVIAMPAGMLDDFVPLWKEYNYRLAGRLDLLEPWTVLCDQISLSLAYTKGQVAFTPFSLKEEEGYPFGSPE